MLLLLSILLLLGTSCTALRITSIYIMKSRVLKKSQINMGIKSPVRYSTQDWLDCIISLPTSRILVRTKKCIAFFTAWAAFVTIVYDIFHLKFTLPGTVQFNYSLFIIHSYTLALIFLSSINSFHSLCAGFGAWSVVSI